MADANNNRIKTLKAHVEMATTTLSFGPFRNHKNDIYVKLAKDGVPVKLSKEEQVAKPEWNAIEGANVHGWKIDVDGLRFKETKFNIVCKADKGLDTSDTVVIGYHCQKSDKKSEKKDVKKSDAKENTGKTGKKEDKAKEKKDKNSDPDEGKKEEKDKNSERFSETKDKSKGTNDKEGEPTADFPIKNGYDIQEDPSDCCAKEFDELDEEDKNFDPRVRFWHRCDSGPYNGLSLCSRYKYIAADKNGYYGCGFMTADGYCVESFRHDWMPFDPNDLPGIFNPQK